MSRVRFAFGFIFLEFVESNNSFVLHLSKFVIFETQTV